MVLGLLTSSLLVRFGVTDEPGVPTGLNDLIPNYGISKCK